MNIGKQFLSELVHYRTYAKYLTDEFRRESKKETIDRNMQMHIDKFPQHQDEIFDAYKAVHEFRAIPSMRSMQFGGEAITRRQNRGYNCCFVNITKFVDIADLAFQSMSGAGVGYSVKSRHISQLPTISNGIEGVTVVIPDSAEGWADSIVALLENPLVQFDYSLIRLMGTPLSSGGTASGPKALIHMHAQVRAILRKAAGRRLTPFEVHRICCLIADCIVVGGVRRSALISLFDPEDTEMLNCKAGSWWEKYPELARANNSAAMNRNNPDAVEIATSIVDACYAGGQAEPGLSWTNHDDYGWNPCQPAWAIVLTKTGIKKLEDVSVGDFIWSKEGWTKILKKWSTGVKSVYRYRTTSGVFYGTENHRVVSDGVKVEARDATSIDSITGLHTPTTNINIQDVMDGLVIGDGSFHGASNNLVVLYIGQDDADYFESEVRGLITKARPGIGPRAHEIITTIQASELNPLPERIVPDRFYYGDRNKVVGFLRGLYSANGSFVDGRVTLKTTSFKLLEQVQAMLSSLGILSYYTTNRSKKVQFSNGEYVCKESYDLNITTDREKFSSVIGYIQKYKTEALDQHISRPRSVYSHNKDPKTTYDIIERTKISEEEVFDITVDNESHTYWTSGCNVSNCHEISLKSAGVCNLTEVNAAACLSQEQWLNAVRSATIIGTLQASYTDFKYVQPEWKKNAEEEALLGVSITGQAENQAILTPENLRLGAELVLQTNREWARKLGINPAKRTTTTKPSGTASSWLGTTAGFHAGHEVLFVRRVRLEKESKLAKALHRHFPSYLVPDPFRESDCVMQIPIRMNDNTLLRSQETSVQALERMKKLYDNWIVPGHVEGPNTHNVSITISYHEHEKEAIRDWMINNRESYYGISLIPYDGGDYKYLPYSQPVHKEIFEILEKSFGECAESFDFQNIKEKKDMTDFKAEASCAGGTCTLD